jgi:hypothetical protein
MTLVATEARAFETLTDGRVVIEAKGRKLAFYPEDGEYIEFAARCPSETKGQLLTKQSSPTLAEVLSNPAVAKCVIEEAQTPFRNFLAVGTFPKDSVLRIVASRKPADFPGGADTLRILVGTGNKPSFKRLPDSPPRITWKANMPSIRTGGACQCRIMIRHINTPNMCFRPTSATLLASLIFGSNVRGAEPRAGAVAT